MKTFHDFKLKDGTRVVMSRSKFCTSFGHQYVNSNESWDTVRMHVSKDGLVFSSIVDRKSILRLKSDLKTSKRNLS